LKTIWNSNFNVIESFGYTPVTYGPSIKDDQMMVVCKCQYNQ